MELDRLSGLCLSGGNGCRGGRQRGLQSRRPKSGAARASRTPSALFGRQACPSATAVCCRRRQTRGGVSRHCCHRFGLRIQDGRGPVHPVIRHDFRSGPRLAIPCWLHEDSGALRARAHARNDDGDWFSSRAMARLERGVERVAGFSADKQDSLLRILDCSRKFNGSFGRTLVGSGVRRRDRFCFPGEEPQAGRIVIDPVDLFGWPSRLSRIQ